MAKNVEQNLPILATEHSSGMCLNMKVLTQRRREMNSVFRNLGLIPRSTSTVRPDTWEWASVSWETYAAILLIHNPCLVFVCSSTAAWATSA